MMIQARPCTSNEVAKQGTGVRRVVLASPLSAAALPLVTEADS